MRQCSRQTGSCAFSVHKRTRRISAALRKSVQKWQMEPLGLQPPRIRRRGKEACNFASFLCFGGAAKPAERFAPRREDQLLRCKVEKMGPCPRGAAQAPPASLF